MLVKFSWHDLDDNKNYSMIMSYEEMEMIMDDDNWNENTCSWSYEIIDKGGDES